MHFEPKSRRRSLDDVGCLTTIPEACHSLIVILESSFEARRIRIETSVRRLQNLHRAACRHARRGTLRDETRNAGADLAVYTYSLPRLAVK